MTPTNTRRSRVSQLVAASGCAHEPHEVPKSEIVRVIQGYLHGLLTDSESSTQLFILMLICFHSLGCTQFTLLFQARRGHLFVLFGILFLFVFDSLNQLLIVYHSVMETVQLQCLLGGKNHQVSSSKCVQVEVMNHSHRIDKVGEHVNSSQ